MSNLEELTSYTTIEDRTTFIDGTDIYNEILVQSISDDRNSNDNQLLNILILFRFVL